MFNFYVMPKISMLGIFLMLIVFGSLAGFRICQFALLMESVWLMAMMFCTNRRNEFSMVLALLLLTIDFAMHSPPAMSVNFAFTILGVGLMVDHSIMVSLAAKRRALMRRRKIK